MATILKETGLSVMVAFALFFLASTSEAQEQTVKAANATEVASAVNEVKPVIVVPASLAKAMVAGKVAAAKTFKKSSLAPKKLVTYFWYKIDDDGNVESFLGQFDSSNIQTATGGCDDADDELCAVGYDADPELETGVPPTGTYVSWHKAL